MCVPEDPSSNIVSTLIVVFYETANIIIGVYLCASLGRINLTYDVDDTLLTTITLLGISVPARFITFLIPTKRWWPTIINDIGFCKLTIGWLVFMIFLTCANIFLMGLLLPHNIIPGIVLPFNPYTNVNAHSHILSDLLGLIITELVFSAIQLIKCLFLIVIIRSRINHSMHQGEVYVSYV